MLLLEALHWGWAWRLLLLLAALHPHPCTRAGWACRLLLEALCCTPTSLHRTHIPAPLTLCSVQAGSAIAPGSRSRAPT